MLRTKIITLLVVVQSILISFPNRSIGNNNSASQRRTPIVDVYEKTHDTVVNISGSRLKSTSVSGYAWPELFEAWGPRYKQQVSVLGSGVVVHEDGYVVTNAHVVKGAENIKIIFSNGDEFSAKIVKADDDKDLALLKVEANKKLPFVHLGRSDDIMIGETVVAIGNPYGYTNTLTTGVISATGRDIMVSEGFWLRGLIQTDASINPGNSGGPLFNINGDLIGINTAIAEGASNIGFSIPVDTLSYNLSQMLMPEKLRRVRMGLNVGRIKTTDRQTGVVVDSVVDSSPAHDAGLLKGDIILTVDGQKLANIIDFYIRMMGKGVGEPISIEYIRPDVNSTAIKKAKLTLLVRPLPDGRQLAMKFFKMEVSELTKKVAADFGFADAYPVLIITKVEPNGTAGKIGIGAGDLILAIRGVTISNIEELSTEMEKISANDLVEIMLMRITVNGYRQLQRKYTVRLKAQTG
jgi:serine protease Do